MNLTRLQVKGWAGLPPLEALAGNLSFCLFTCHRLPAFQGQLPLSGSSKHSLQPLPPSYRDLTIAMGPRDNPEQSHPFKVHTWIISEKSILPCKAAFSQVPGIRMEHLWGVIISLHNDLPTGKTARGILRAWNQLQFTFIYLGRTWGTNSPRDECRYQPHSDWVYMTLTGIWKMSVGFIQ